MCKQTVRVLEPSGYRLLDSMSDKRKSDKRKVSSSSFLTYIYFASHVHEIF